MAKRNPSPRDAQRRQGAQIRQRATDSSMEARMGARISPQPDGCWAWDGQLDSYGTVNLPRSGNTPRTTNAHRWVYETLVAPVPKGHHVHHECLRPGCVNPAHMKVLTASEHRLAHLALAKH